MEVFAFDDEYLQRLREGDRWTEEHFFAYFSQLLLIKLRRRLRSLDDLDEVRQEVFVRTLRAIRAPGVFREGSRLGSFVNSIANNVVLEFYESRKARSGPLDEAPPSPEVRGSSVDAETDDLMPRFVLAWDPSRLSSDQYAELIAALGDFARASGALGIQRIASEVLGLDQALGQ